MLSITETHHGNRRPDDSKLSVQLLNLPVITYSPSIEQVNMTRNMGMHRAVNHACQARSSFGAFTDCSACLSVLEALTLLVLATGLCPSVFVIQVSGSQCN